MAPTTLPLALIACSCCLTEIVFDVCESCAAMKRRGNCVQRGVRMASGTEHAMIFAAEHIDGIRPEDWPRILENNRACFEADFARHNVPEEQRVRLRSEMLSWKIIGWSDQVSREDTLSR